MKTNDNWETNVIEYPGINISNIHKDLIKMNLGPHISLSEMWYWMPRRRSDPLEYNSYIVTSNLLGHCVSELLIHGLRSPLSLIKKYEGPLQYNKENSL